MQGTQVRALVQEDPTCLRATKPASHNYWACAQEPTSHNYWAHVPVALRACAPQQEKPTQGEMKSPRTAMKSSPHSQQPEEAHVQQRRPNTAKNK